MSGSDKAQFTLGHLHAHGPCMTCDFSTAVRKYNIQRDSILLLHVRFDYLYFCLFLRAHLTSHPKHALTLCPIFAYLVRRELRKRKRHVGGLFMPWCCVHSNMPSKREITSNTDRLAPAYLGGEWSAIWRLPRDVGGRVLESFFSGFHRAERDEYVRGLSYCYFLWL